MSFQRKGSEKGIWERDLGKGSGKRIWEKDLGKSLGKEHWERDPLLILILIPITSFLALFLNLFPKSFFKSLSPIPFPNPFPRSFSPISFLLFALLALSACSTQLNEILSTQLTENYAMASNGAIASDPSINDGKTSTSGHSQGEDREFIIDLGQERHIRKVVIINDNLFRFELQYWDDNKMDSKGQMGDWRTAYNVRQRGGTEPGSEVVVPKFDIRTNFKSKKIRVIVNRSIDDKVASKFSVDKDDKVVDRRVGRNLFGQRTVYYRVLIEAPAKIWEIEAYGLVKRQ